MLAGRHHLQPGIETFAGVDEALTRAAELAKTRGAAEIMVIGGAEIYRQTLDRADRLYWTVIHADPAGDTLFPFVDRLQWVETGREVLPRGPKDDFAATRLTFDRTGR